MMQYVYLPDVVKFIIASFTIQSGIYNVGGDEYISMADTANMIASYFSATTAKNPEKPPFQIT